MSNKTTCLRVFRRWGFVLVSVVVLGVLLSQLYYLVPLAGAVGIYFGVERYLSRRSRRAVLRQLEEAHEVATMPASRIRLDGRPTR
jgi:hypothetical protein